MRRKTCSSVALPKLNDQIISLPQAIIVVFCENSSAPMMVGISGLVGARHFRVRGHVTAHYSTIAWAGFWRDHQVGPVEDSPQGMERTTLHILQVGYLGL